MSEGTESAGANVPVDVETTAAPETETPVTETATEETKAEAVEPEPAEETEDRPKRESGYSRMKRRALLAEAQLANARLKEATGTKAADPKEDKAPREEDYNGDWGKYIAATAAHEAAKAVKGSLADDKRAAQETHVADLQRQVLDDFNERVEEFKSKAKDFDEVVNSFVAKQGKFSDVVRELVMDSDVGPELTYHLAKNPALANKLNGLNPLQAAKEIGRIEDTLSKPSVKTTKALPPMTDVKGGASPSTDLATLAKSDNASDYIAQRRKEREALGR